MKLVELTFNERLPLVQFLYARQRTAAEGTNGSNEGEERKRDEKRK